MHCCSRYRGSRCWSCYFGHACMLPGTRHELKQTAANAPCNMPCSSFRLSICIFSSTCPASFIPHCL
jgi:hypothetical protein